MKNTATTTVRAYTLQDHKTIAHLPYAQITSLAANYLRN